MWVRGGPLIIERPRRRSRLGDLPAPPGRKSIFGGCSGPLKAIPKGDSNNWLAIGAVGDGASNSRAAGTGTSPGPPRTAAWRNSYRGTCVLGCDPP